MSSLTLDAVIWGCLETLKSVLICIEIYHLCYGTILKSVNALKIKISLGFKANPLISFWWIMWLSFDLFASVRAMTVLLIYSSALAHYIGFQNGCNQMSSGGVGSAKIADGVYPNKRQMVIMIYSLSLSPCPLVFLLIKIYEFLKPCLASPRILGFNKACK